MLKNHLKVAWRTLLKNKTTSLINLFGLTLGLSTVFLIGLYVHNELRTDTEIPHQDRTFRVVRLADINGDQYTIGVTSAPFATGLREDFMDEIEETVRVMPDESLVQVGEDLYQEDAYFYADPNFMDFFDFPLLIGDAETALINPNSVVLTIETARRYFENEFEAVGQTLRINDEYEATVTGVFADITTPSHLQFDLVESTTTLHSNEGWSIWWNNMLCTYARLSPGVNAAQLELKFPAFMDKYFGDDFERIGNRIDLSLQPIANVYFDADTRYDPMPHGNRGAVRIFFIAALFLILIACFNYVNLTTAKAIERSTEVGIYKALGAGRSRIVSQMLGESFLLSTVSVVVGALLAYYARPMFETAFDVQLPIAFSQLELSLLFVGIILGLTILAGLYPGWLLASFNIIPAIKGSARVGGQAVTSMRRVLVVFQFVLSIALLGSTLVIQQQLSYLQNKDLGFDQDQVLVLTANDPEIYDQRDLFERLLREEPGVIDVTYSSGYPGNFHDATTVQFAGIQDQIRMRTLFVDFDYIDTYGLRLKAGRDFNADLATDSTDVLILNEKAVQEMGMTIDEVLGLQGRLPMFDDQPRIVIGVVEDYHFESLHGEIEPLVMATSFNGWNIGIKAEAGRVPEVIAAAEETWNSIASSYPFAFEFLDERLNALYANEERQGNLFGLFAAIAILIACLGMFGLAAFSTSLRTKEIGIRKVLGASVSSIVALLSRDYLLQVLIAFGVATPIAYLAMQRWLEGFAYQVALGPGIFILAGVLALLLVLATVSIQSIKTAITNPVHALRNE